MTGQEWGIWSIIAHLTQKRLQKDWLRHYGRRQQISNEYANYMYGNFMYGRALPYIIGTINLSYATVHLGKAANAKCGGLRAADAIRWWYIDMSGALTKVQIDGTFIITIQFSRRMIKKKKGFKYFFSVIILNEESKKIQLVPSSRNFNNAYIPFLAKLLRRETIWQLRVIIFRERQKFFKQGFSGGGCTQKKSPFIEAVSLCHR